MVIISTIRRSDSKDIQRALGLLATPKGMNVALTRAQALLVVIGNAPVLRANKGWDRFMKFVQEGGGWQGVEWETKCAEPSPNAGARVVV